MDDTKGNNGDAGASTHLGVWRFGAIALLCIIVAVAFYYGTSLERENTFADEKAFRVLAEVVTQINNLQASRATLLNAMPTQILQSMPDCGEQLEFLTTGQHRLYSQHIERLDLTSAIFCRSQVKPS